MSSPVIVTLTPNPSIDRTVSRSAGGDELVHVPPDQAAGGGAEEPLQRLVRVPDPPNPVQALKAFLDVFGVELSLPGLGTSRLFLGGTMKVPFSVVTESDACSFLTQVVMDQWREPFSMISNTRMSEVGPFINVNLLAFYAQKRYWKAIRGK